MNELRLWLSYVSLLCSIILFHKMCGPQTLWLQHLVSWTSCQEVTKVFRFRSRNFYFRFNALERFFLKLVLLIYIGFFGFEVDKTRGILNPSSGVPLHLCCLCCCLRNGRFLHCEEISIYWCHVSLNLPNFNMVKSRTSNFRRGFAMLFFNPVVHNSWIW